MAYGLAVSEHAGRSLGGSLAMLHRLCEIGGVAGVREVLGQLGSVVVEPSSVQHLQRSPDLLVEPDAPRRNDLLVQRLLEEGVSEAVADIADARVLLEHP